MNRILFLTLFSVCGAVASAQHIQPGELVTPLPAASTLNYGKTYWTYGSTSTDCSSGTGNFIVACKSNGNFWSATSLTFQGSAYLNVSESNGVVHLSTVGPVDTIQGSQGVCITGTSPSLVSLCSSSRHFIYSGSNDALQPGDCGNTVVYTVNPSIAANTAQFGVSLGSATKCDVLLINQSASKLVLTPASLQTISTKSSLTVPASSSASNPFFVETISDTASPGSWIVGRNNLISPLEVQVNGIDTLNQFKLNIQKGQGAIDVQSGSDGASIIISGPSVSFNGQASVNPAQMNFYGGFGINVVPDAYGGLRIDCNTCGGSSNTSGHSAGFGSWSSLPGSCNTGDVYTLTGGAYDFATCSSNVWTPYSEGVPVTIPSRLPGFQTWKGSATGYVFNDPADSGQGYDTMTVAASGSASSYGNTVWRRWTITNFSVTGTVAANSPTITNVSSMTNITIGMGITGPGFLPGTTVAATHSSPNTITLSQATPGNVSSGTQTLRLTQVPIRLEGIFAPPLLWNFPSYRFVSFGFMDSTGAKGTLDCGSAYLIGEALPFCRIRTWDATGKVAITGGAGDQYVANGYGSSSGHFSMYAAFDGQNISFGFCMKPVEDHCLLAYKNSVASLGLADVTYFTAGFSWNTSAADPNQTGTTWFLGTYAPTP